MIIQSDLFGIKHIQNDMAMSTYLCPYCGMDLERFVKKQSENVDDFSVILHFPKGCCKSPNGNVECDESHNSTMKYSKSLHCEGCGKSIDYKATIQDNCKDGQSMCIEWVIIDPYLKYDGDYKKVWINKQDE